MDDKWFKKQQKIVGVTAEDIADALGRDRSLVSRLYVGRQRMTLDQAKVFAQVLKVPLTDVLEKAGVADTPTVRELQPGFSESDAAVWDPKSKDMASIQSAATTFGGGRPGIDIWRVKSGAMALQGMLPEDFMLIDTHQSERCKAGDVVIAQVYNWNTGEANTILRRFEPPVLVAASTDPDDHRVHVVDSNNVVIKGKVIASWRTVA